MYEMKLLLINSSIVATVTFVEIEMALKIAVLSATLVYTLYKLFKEYRNK
jgi:hypothetical protein